MSPLVFWTARRRRQQELTAAAIAEHAQRITDAATNRTREHAVERLTGRAEAHLADAHRLDAKTGEHRFHTAVAHELLDAARDISGGDQ